MIAISNVATGNDYSPATTREQPDTWLVNLYVFNAPILWQYQRQDQSYADEVFLPPGTYSIPVRARGARVKSAVANTPARITLELYQNIDLAAGTPDLRPSIDFTIDAAGVPTLSSTPIAQGGTAKTIVRGGAKGATAAADLTGTAEGADHQALDVQLYNAGVAIAPAAAADVLAATKLEDDPSASGDRGMFALGVRNDTLGAQTGADKDYGGFAIDRAGQVMVVPTPATLSVTGTGIVGAGVTITLPAVAGEFHYITAIEITRLCLAAPGAPAQPNVTTTNLPGVSAFGFVIPAAIGSEWRYMPFEHPIKAAVVNTATTIVAPAIAAVGWRLNAWYYTAP